MYTSQQALITQIKAGRATNYSSVAADNIKAYAGEFQDILKFEKSFPLVLVWMALSNPAAFIPELNAEIFVCTKSGTFERLGNKNDGLQLVESMTNYLKLNPHFTYSNEDYLIDVETLQARPFAITNKHSIIQVTLSFKEGLQ